MKVKDFKSKFEDTTLFIMNNTNVGISDLDILNSGVKQMYLEEVINDYGDFELMAYKIYENEMNNVLVIKK